MLINGLVEFSVRGGLFSRVDVDGADNLTLWGLKRKNRVYFL